MLTLSVKKDVLLHYLYCMLLLLVVKWLSRPGSSRGAPSCGSAWLPWSLWSSNGIRTMGFMLSTTYFQFNSCFYQQVFHTPMGSPGQYKIVKWNERDLFTNNLNSWMLPAASVSQTSQKWRGGSLSWTLCWQVRLMDPWKFKPITRRLVQTSFWTSNHITLSSTS